MVGEEWCVVGVVCGRGGVVCGRSGVVGEEWCGRGGVVW